MSDGLLAGKRVLVTGAAGGIGAEISKVAAEEGASAVVLTDLRLDDLAAQAKVVEHAGARALTIEADLASEPAISRLVDGALAAAGGIDVLINAAGIHERQVTQQSGTDELAPELWNRVLAINLTAPWLLTKLLCPAMAAAGGGSIVNIASQLGLVGAQRSPAYTTSKAGLIQLTRSSAVDLAPLGIRCNCVAPGAIETPMTEQIFAGTDDPAASRTAALGSYVIKRFGAPDDVASTVCFLASDRSAWTTGACFVIDGGQTAWR